jgi:hypothetical protein
MRKALKSLLALMMSGCMAFSVTACDLFSAPPEDSSSESNGSSSSAPETPPETPPVTPTVTETKTEYLVKAKVAPDQNGADLYLTVQSKTPDSLEETVQEMYLIDDFVYVPYNPNSGNDYDKFVQSPSTFWYALAEETGMSETELKTAVFELLAQMGGMLGGEKEENAANNALAASTGLNETADMDFLTLLSSIATTSITQKGNEVTVVVDMKDFANDILDYFGSLTGTTTIGKVLNDALAFVDETFTYETVMNEIVAVKDVTLGEFYEEKALEIQTETGMTVQEIKDGILAAPMVAEILARQFGAETVNEWQALQVETFVTENEQTTLEDVIVAALVGDTQGEKPTLEQVFAGLKTGLQTITLADISADMVATFAMLNRMDATDLKWTITLCFEGETVTSANVAFDFGLQMNVSSTWVQKSTVSVVIDVEIVESVDLPTDVTIYNVCNDCGKTSVYNTIVYCQVCNVFYCYDCHGGEHNG